MWMMMSKSRKRYVAGSTPVTSIKAHSLLHTSHVSPDYFLSLQAVQNAIN